MKAKKHTSVFMASVLTVLGSQLVVKLAGFVYRLVITNIEGFGDIGNGFYSAGFQLYTLLLSISSIGIPGAISKLVAESVAVGDTARANHIFKTALWLFCGIGLLCFAGLFFGADFIALHIIRMDGVQATLRALAPSILFVCLSSVIRGFYLGFGTVSATSVSQMLEQIFKSILTVFFVLALTAYSAEIMSAGANFATSVATLLSLLYLLWFHLRHCDTAQTNNVVPKSTRHSFWALSKTILQLSIPISLTSVIISVGRVIDTATITRGIAIAFASHIPGQAGIPTAAQLNEEAVRLSGMLSKSDTLINLPLALNIAFATVLVPTISSAVASHKPEEATDKITLSLLISILLALPCAAGMIVLAKPIYLLIYPNASSGYRLLQVSAISMIFVALNQTICGSLQGLGKVEVPVKALLCGVGLKVILNIFLIRMPQIHIYGAPISSVVCYGVACGICFVSLCRTLSIPLSIGKYIGKPLLCTGIMTAVTCISYSMCIKLLHSNLYAVLFTLGLSILVYAVLVLRAHIFTEQEIAQLPFGDKLQRHFQK
ncbi:MAG: putative polysaccharide biosynthesis protein [Oscillospiraceae bacterium]|jgi:stage V sporulation protein B